MGCSLHTFPNAEPQQKLGLAAGEAPELQLQSPDPSTSNPSAGFATAHTRSLRIRPAGDTSELPAAQEAHEIPALGFSKTGQALQSLGWGLPKLSAQHPNFWSLLCKWVKQVRPSAIAACTPNGSTQLAPAKGWQVAGDPGVLCEAPINAGGAGRQLCTAQGRM